MKSSLGFLDPAGRSQRKSYCLANARKVQQQEEEESPWPCNKSLARPSSSDLIKILSEPCFLKKYFLFRSFYLSLEIKKALRNQESKNQRINLICPNGVSYVIGQWAIWMSGNCCVPLSGQHSTNALEYYIKDSDSVLVITAPSTVDKVLSTFPESLIYDTKKVLDFHYFCIFLPLFPKLRLKNILSEFRLEKFARRLESPSFVKIQISLHTQILTLKMRDLFHH